MPETRQEPLFDDAMFQEPGILPEDHQAVWSQFLAVVLQLPTALDTSLRKADDLALTEYIVLSLLAEAPNLSQRMTTIARDSHLSAPRTTHLVARMEKRGLIERRSGDADGRAIIATLTAEGVAVLKTATPVYETAVQQRVFDRLTEEQISQLRDIAAAIDIAPR